MNAELVSKIEEARKLFKKLEGSGKISREDIKRSLEIRERLDL